jgi:hypothetical protein
LLSQSTGTTARRPAVGPVLTDSNPYHSTGSGLTGWSTGDSVSRCRSART